MKQVWQLIPRHLKLILILSVILTSIFIVMRVIFYIMFDDTAFALSTADTLKAFWLGSRFDLRVALAILLPLYLVGWISWLSPFKSKGHRYVWMSYISLMFGLMMFVYFVDIGHYSYLKTRLDFTAMRFLEDFSISMEMVWESYPIVWITLGYSLVIGLFTFGLNKIFKSLEQSQITQYGLLKNIGIGVVSFLIVVVAVMSKFSQYPLRWSEAAFSHHPFAAQLTYNPMHYLFDTWKNGRITYNVEKTRTAYNLMAEYLGVDNPNAQTLSYQRDIPAKQMNTKPNIVVVLVESFATYKTSMSGNPLNPTPHVKKLADEGYYFSNYFTPSTGTARSVWTTITSMPDTELKGTSSRNPLIVDQHCVANDFEGYEKFYFLGGSASWGNIRGVLNKNIDNLHLYEEGSYSAPRNDVWGISDIDLFREANAVFKTQKKPFFAMIQTSGDHRPYTIPDETYGFEVVDMPDSEVTDHGFHSVKELNAFRLMDHSINHFIELAKEAGYAENTIFAFWGDHGLDGSVGDHALFADNTSQLGLGSHRVPLIIWAPGIIKEPMVIKKVASETDIFPTMAGLAGVSYSATTMGRDLFDVSYDDARYAFTIKHSNPPQIGLIGKNFYYKTLTDGRNEGLHKIYSDTPLKDHSKEYPEVAAKMKALTQSIYETVKYMAYHNKRSDMNKE